MVSAVIAAYNEAATVAQAVSDVIGHPELDEVIVIDDGSTDSTAELAASAGARVVKLPENVGKAAAMAAGVAEAGGEVLLFLDADITGLSHESVGRIIRPVVEGRVDMHVGLRARKTLWLNRFLRVFPIIGGERAVTRRLWELVPEPHRRGYRIEVALNYTAKRFGRGMSFHLVEGITHRTKESKFGWFRGLLRRLDMIGQVAAVTWSLYIVGAIRDSLSRPRSQQTDDQGG